jgi:polysaccharide deacetylase family protein (PEP-CTERM system associated)
MQNIFAVDFEAWYHPEYVRKQIPKPAENNLDQGCALLLDLFNEHNTEATFFILGEIAESEPEIIEKIHENNHEIGFHGYDHKPLSEKTPITFRKEVKRFNKTIQDTTGQKPRGFRAPSYSLDNNTVWALRTLRDEGYLYDTSLFPIKTPLYGMRGVPYTPYNPSFDDLSKHSQDTKFLEIPATTTKLLFLRIPICGGFYLRALPLSLIKSGIRRMNRAGYPAVISIHPWEITPNTPRMQIGLTRSFVTYYNIQNTWKKLSSLLKEFKFTSSKNMIETLM